MSLYRRGDIWWSRIELDGAVHQFSTKAHNKNAARAIEAQKRTELAKGRAGLAAPTLQTFVTRFINALPSRVSKQTFVFYVRHLQPLLQFPALAGCRLDRIQPAVIEDFVQWRRKQNNGRAGRISVVTVNHNLRTLRRALHLAVEWDVIAKVPKIKLLSGENQRDYVLTDDVVGKFVSEKGLIGRIVPFLVDTGLRRAEAVNLTWDAVTLDSTPCSVEIRKGKSKYSRRRVPLTTRAERILRELKAAHDNFAKQQEEAARKAQKDAKSPTPHVFTIRKTVHISSDWLSHSFLRTRKRLELPKECVLHCTRHTFCTRLGERGADAFAIQRLAGHSSILISQRYVHATGPRLESAITLLEPPTAA